MKKSVIVSLHLLWWTMILGSLAMMPFLARYSPPKQYVDVVLFGQLMKPVFFYLGYFIAMPLLGQRKPVYYKALAIVAVLLLVALLIGGRDLPGIAFSVFNFLFSLLFSIVNGALFRFFIDWFSKRKERDRLKREQLKSELALLRSQVNPHFLFNTLNNIDSLIKNDPGKASESLIRVSEMMRYMLYESSSERVPLSQEITYIRHYVELEKLRAVDADYISFEVSGDPGGIQVAPMLFIPFVENAFKHSPVADPDNRIVLRLNIPEHRIEFSCRNTIGIHQEKDKTPGIGLSTVTRRLNLLYPATHELIITKDTQTYTVQLTLDY